MNLARRLRQLENAKQPCAKKENVRTELMENLRAQYERISSEDIDAGWLLRQSNMTVLAVACFGPFPWSDAIRNRLVELSGATDVLGKFAQTILALEERISQ